MLSLVAGARSMRTIVSPTCTPARCAGPARSETTTKPRVDGSTLIADAGVCRRRLLPHELVVARREVRGVRIAERRDDLVDRAELQHGGGHRPVVRARRAPPAPGRRRVGIATGEVARLPSRQPVADDERPGEGEPGNQRGSGGAASGPREHSARAAGDWLDLEEAAEREAGAGRAEQEPGARASASAFSANGRAWTSDPPLRCGRIDGRATSLPTHEQDHREERAAEAAEQALEHERPADEPVRRPDELHHLDLTAPREDRESDRVRDQERARQ